MTKTAKVTQNIYGNYRGKATGSLSVQLGCQEFDAKFWLAQQVKAGAVVHKDSVITADQAAQFSHLID